MNNRPFLIRTSLVAAALGMLAGTSLMVDASPSYAPLEYSIPLSERTHHLPVIVKDMRHVFSVAQDTDNAKVTVISAEQPTKAQIIQALRMVYPHIHARPTVTKTLTTHEYNIKFLYTLHSKPVLVKRHLLVLEPTI